MSKNETQSLSKSDVAKIEEAKAVVQDIRTLMHGRRPAEEIVDSCARIPQNPPKVALSAAQCDARLTPQQNLAIAHLLAGRTYSQTAELIKVDRSTIYEWRNNPVFADRLVELSNEALQAIAMGARDTLLRSAQRLTDCFKYAQHSREYVRVLSSNGMWRLANRLPRMPDAAGDRAQEEPGTAATEKAKSCE